MSGVQGSIILDGDLSNVGTVQKIEEIGRISAFPEFRQPYNEMVMLEIPGFKGSFNIEYVTPDKEMEILAVTVSSTGYGEGDKFDLKCNETIWFKNWYLNEVKEGLYLGTSTFACRVPPLTRFNVDFVNASGTRKTVWVGFRMLTASPEQLEQK